jgi:hypothetical protein
MGNVIQWLRSTDALIASYWYRDILINIFYTLFFNISHFTHKNSSINNKLI